MHPDEIEIDISLVRRLLAGQFPKWARLSLEPVVPLGTDNALYRLGDDLVVRLPRRAPCDQALQKECRTLPKLAPHLPLPIPLPQASGLPSPDYPFHWAVYQWVKGQNAVIDRISDGKQLAIDLALFLRALQQVDTNGGPQPGEHNFFRGAPLAMRDKPTRAAIAILGPSIDRDLVMDAWEASLRAPEWSRPPVWIHGDLDSRNLLLENGRLCGVIDFGGLGVGDPACDTMVAWKILPADARGVFRTALRVDDATWARSRGWALSQALAALSYYTPETNRILVLEAQRWLTEVLTDHTSTLQADANE
jgi:aminoglycoside phosphotransferase (APT) family kinase protein